jgi:obg-like ATPase 1
LILKDIDFLKTHQNKLEKKRDGSNKSEIEFIKSVIVLLEEGKEVRLKKDWKSKEIEYLNEYQLITAKPVVYLINMSPTDYFKQKNKWLSK